MIATFILDHGRNLEPCRTISGNFLNSLSGAACCALVVTLKSERISPYFFNAGLFNSSMALARLGRYCATAILDAGLKFDTLFGPLTKGIPLVAAVAIALAEQHGLDIP